MSGCSLDLIFYSEVSGVFDLVSRRGGSFKGKRGEGAGFNGERRRREKM